MHYPSVIYSQTWVEWEGSFLLISHFYSGEVPLCTYFSLYIITFLLRHSAGIHPPWVTPHRSVRAPQAPRCLVCSWSWMCPDKMPMILVHGAGVTILPKCKSLTLEHAIANLYDNKAIALELWSALQAHFEGKGLVAVAALAAWLWQYVMLLDKTWWSRSRRSWASLQSSRTLDFLYWKSIKWLQF